MITNLIPSNIRKSLRWKLVLSAALIATSMLLLLIANNVRLQDELIDKHRQHDISEIPKLLNLSLANNLFKRNYAGTQVTLNELQSSPDTKFTYLLVIDERGMPFAQAGSVDFKALPAVQSKPDRNELIFHGALPLHIGAQQVGTLRYGLDFSGLFNARKEALRQSALIAIVTVALTIASLVYFGRLLTRNMERLMQTARRISAGNYDEKAEVASEDEIGQLASDINEMSRAISSQIDALKKSEARFRQALDNMLEGCMILGFDWTYLYLNETAAKHGQNKRENLIGRTLLEMYPGMEKSAIFVHYRRCMEERIPQRFEESYTFANGVTTWYTFSVEPVDEGIFVLSLDITENKKSQEQLQHSVRSLAEAQRIANLGNWELDLVSNVLTWSDEIYRIFEIDPEKFVATYEAFLDAIHPDDRDRVNSAYAESVKNRTPYNIVHRLLMKDGRVKYVNERCETHYAEDGMPLRSFGTVHDITEQKVAELALIALKNDLENRVSARTAELEDANKELESFSYSVSHDLRTPLRAIDGFSRMLLEDYTGKLDDEGKRMLHVVRDNTNRMSQLIDDILRFSRVGRIEISHAEIDMEGLVREVLDELKETIAGRKLQINLGSLPNAMGDRTMMHQVIENLLSNAIKFSAGKEEARIDIGASLEDKQVIYHVKDNGAGFDMQYVNKLFGVFQRLHGIEEFEGTGIGLAIVKRIITRHGGKVWAEGEVGKGAAFYFSIPVPSQSKS